ncbi:dihydrolipoamide acetyltransferase family protein [Lentzea sp. HUAS TT2]|uniref:dihydrolipoamide acetyltransferase family protein n=1 Tax=Lentzea sp. HUAS TT2 TaxID=3447454 RepID=UPI003F6F214F
MAEFTMPSLGADMDEGTVIEWLVKPGDTVARGDVVAVVDTAKAAVEAECFDSGVIEDILVQPGTTVPVGTPLAVIGTADGAKPKREPWPEHTPQAEPRPEAAVVPVPAPESAVELATVSASQPESAPSPAPQPKPVPVPNLKPAPRPPVVGPLVRKLSAELGVDLTTVRGTGRGGAITRADVQRAARPAPAGRGGVSPYARRLAKELGVDLTQVTASATDGVVRAGDVRAAKPVPEQAERATRAPVTPAVDKVQAMRQATAKLMARSKREIPHYYLSTTVDMSTAMARLAELNRDLPVERRVLPIALVLRACARAAAKVPQLNGSWTDERFQPGAGVRLGMAVALRGGGLIVPVIADATELGPVELMDRVRDLVTRARSGRLRGSELTGATITVTNLGDRGVESVFGVIHPPQVALVGVGKVVERPWAVDGLLGVRPVVTVTLSADHRATDGHTGARFLEIVEKLLNTPEEP